MPDTIKVILDTDIGSDIDDAVALAYLLSQPRCELLGITTVTGQPELRAEMASAICRNVGRDDIPIHSGCPTPLLVPQKQPEAPQAKALGPWDRRRDFPANTAVEFLRETIRAHPHEVTLLTIGPLTNAGLLFATDPEIPALLNGLVLMCGRFFASMGGEWNAIGDPHATAIVYGGMAAAVCRHAPASSPDMAANSGRHATLPPACARTQPPRHVSFGLDVTTQCVMQPDDCRARFTAKALRPVRDFAEIWFGNRPAGIVFHDPLAAACIFEPDLCQHRHGQVTISLNEPTMGWTIFSDSPPAKPHAVASAVDAKRFFEHYFDIVQ